MYELIQAGPKTWYIDCPAKIGLFELGPGHVCLIDSGSDKDAAKKVLKHLEGRGWTLDGVFCTHSHADHIGGCALLQQRTACAVYLPGPDRAFGEFPLLEPAFLYGGRPPKALRNKFLMAQPCAAQALTEASLPPGLTLRRVDGHSFAMAALRTEDDVWFLADCLTGENILEKYHVSFLYDPAGYMESLRWLMTLQARCFIPAHAAPCGDIRPLAQRNLDALLELLSLLRALCAAPLSFEDLLKAVFDYYGLDLDFGQYALVGSAIRSCLSYLLDAGGLSARFVDNRLLWQAADQTQMGLAPAGADKK